MKAACFVGTAREDLAAFPESARRRAGYELFMVQVGREPADFKPIPSVGPGTYEIRVRDEAGAFRVIYVAKFERAVSTCCTPSRRRRGRPHRPTSNLRHSVTS